MGTVNVIPIIESHFGVDHEAFELTGSIRTVPQNQYKAVGISEGVIWNQKGWDLSRISHLKRSDANEDGGAVVNIMPDGRLVFEKTLVSYDRSYRKHVNSGKYVATTIVNKLKDGSIEIFTEYGFKSFLFAQEIAKGTFNDPGDLAYLKTIYPDMPDDKLLGTNYWLFTPTNVAVDPVYEFIITYSYELEVLTLTPAITKDGVPVVNPSIRWEWKLETPSAFTAKIGDTWTGNNLRITTNSRNRRAIFLPSPKGFSVTGYYKGVDGKENPINVTQVFEGDLQLPEYEIPFVL